MNHIQPDEILGRKITLARKQYRAQTSPLVLRTESLLANAPRKRLRIGFKCALAAAAAMTLVIIVVNQPGIPNNPSPSTPMAGTQSLSLSLSGLSTQIRTIGTHQVSMNTGKYRASRRSLTQQPTFPSISGLHNQINALRKERDDEKSIS